MKPITFESIRNFLKTKKKNKKDGADTSFKRSDSFKRISIRKSYLDRGRNKRLIRAAVQSQKSVAQQFDIDSVAVDTREVKNGIFVGRPMHASFSNMQNGDKSDDSILKNKSLQEINEICGGVDGDYDTLHVPVAVNEPGTSGNSAYNSLRETEVQTIEIDFHGGGNSTESLYNDLTEVTIENNVNVSEITLPPKYSDNNYDYVSDDDELNEKKFSKLNIIDEDDDQKSNFSNSSYFLFEENIYDKADAIKQQSNNSSGGSVTKLNPDKTFMVSLNSINFDDENESRSSSTKRQHSSNGVNAILIDHRSKFGSKNSLDINSLRTSSTLEIPSLVTFKTYCEPKMYLETSFDNPEPHSIIHSLESTKSNISRTSLNNYEATPATDSRTYKLPNKNNADGVVIHIPATKTDLTIDSMNKQNLNKQISNDSALDVEEFENAENTETSLNGKFTFEIYKQLQQTQKLSSQKRDDHSNKKIIEEASYEDSRAFAAHHQSLISFNIGDNSNIISSNEDEPFSSLQIENIINPKTSYFDPDLYDVISPDASVPYPMRTKINPFTRQKELYSVNLGRVWKQLNLGDQPDLSIDPSAATVQQVNFKTKNESFKSMSSHDSGFSLTLTKPKHLFRRKSKKSRRKPPKLSVSRDGYFKRVMASQQNSVRRKKKKSATKQQSNIFGLNGNDTFMYRNNLFDQSFYETFSRYYRDSRRDFQYGNNYNDNNDIFMKEFEEFCIRRNKTKHTTDKHNLANFDKFFHANNDDDVDEDDSANKYHSSSRDVDNFTQEISDLEAFFEEHLKRLKEYYLEKKQLTERSINEIYHDYDQHDENDDDDDVDIDEDDDLLLEEHKLKQQQYLHNNFIINRKENTYDDTFIMGTMYDTLKRKQQMYLNRIDHSLDYRNKELKSLDLNSIIQQDDEEEEDPTMDDFKFPHPDKRVSTANKKRNKFQILEVRPIATVETTSNDHLKYATLEFQKNSNITAPLINPDDGVPYADLLFPTKDFLKFPYSRFKSNENRRQSRRALKLSSETICTKEISLSSIFPSIDATCQMCHKKQRRRPNEKIINNKKSSNNVDNDQLPSDEFSENEFITNSIGCELCTNCDRMYSECLCSVDPNVNWCCCVNNDLLRTHLNTSKRKVKRKKSRRRIGKNHSTLRRGYNYHSSKFFFF